MVIYCGYLRAHGYKGLRCNPVTRPHCSNDAVYLNVNVAQQQHLSNKHLLRRTFPPDTFLPGNSPSLFTWCRTFPPSITTIRQSTIYSDLPLTCTKLIEVDRLGSGVWVSVSFQIFVLTAGEKYPRWREKLSGGDYLGKYVLG